MKATWRMLSTVESFRVVKSMYIWLVLVPIAAKATAKIDGLKNLMIFGEEFVVEVGLPFSWEVFYFSAWAFVLGNVLVIWKCPKIVLENADYASFKAQGKGRTHLFRYWEEIGGSSKDFELMWRMPDSTPRDRRDAVREEIQSGTFWTVFNDAQLLRPWPRIASGVCYLVGFLLIICVLFQNLFFVIKFLYF